MIPEDERKNDMLNWYEPKWQHIKAFLLLCPMQPQHQRKMMLNLMTECPKPPAAGLTGFHAQVYPPHPQPAFIRAEAERAALITKAAALKFKHQDKEEELNQKKNRTEEKNGDARAAN